MPGQYEAIIGKETSLRKVFRTLDRVAPTETTVLVTGESGTGKEVAVRHLHAMSRRASGPFVAVNCGAIPRDLLESELFGHEKGAFTGAVHSRKGRFELAEGGTVFLDEIGEMDPLLQVKLLRVVQEHEIEPVGSRSPRHVDVRVVAATNRNLEDEVAAGRFREDLYYRLNVIPVHLPPLRARGADILLLADAFLRRFCQEIGRDTLSLAEDARKLLSAYPWPGNVRELENLMNRMSVLTEGDVIQACDLPRRYRQGTDVAGDVADAETDAASGEWTWPTVGVLQQQGMTMKRFLGEMEQRLIAEALAVSGGSQTKAAALLGLGRTTMLEKLRRGAGKSSRQAEEQS